MAGSRKPVAAGKETMKLLMTALATLILATGCSTDKFHSLMREKPAELSDFLPNHDLLVLQPATFPVHYFWSDTNAVVKADFKNVYVAPVETSYLRKCNAYDELSNKIVGLDHEIDNIAAYAREAFTKEFAKHAAETGLTVVDDPTLPNTMILEMAIVSFVPTRTGVQILGFAGSFAVPGIDIISNKLSDGSLAIECRVRDSSSKEVVAMFADAESDPSAILQVAKFTFTASAKINLRRLAEMIVKGCILEDFSKVKRSFPVEVLTLPREANLDK